TVTRPQLADGRYISLSHSHGAAAAAIDRTPVGVDVECVREIDEKVARHFMVEKEIASMEQCTILHRVLHWWCAKEALWKQQGGALRSLKQIRLRLEAEGERGLRFSGVETFATGDYVAGLTRPTP